MTGFSQHLLRLPCLCEIGFTVFEEYGRPADTHFQPCERHSMRYLIGVLFDLEQALPELMSDAAIGRKMMVEAGTEK